MLIFLNIIFSLTLIGIFSYGIYKKTNKLPFSMVGIVGTFIGIMYCLMNFNVNTIEQSIPEILNGMKLAFFVTGFAFALSLILNAILKFYFKIEFSESTGNINVDITAVIEKITQSIKNQESNILLFSEKQEKTLNNILQGFNDLNSNVSILQEPLKNLDSLNIIKVINFNIINLIEKIENLKSNEVNTSNTELDLTTINILLEKLDLLKGSFNDIPTIANNLNAMLTKLDSQTNISEQNIETFIKISEKAGEILPVINEKLTEIVELQNVRLDKQLVFLQDKLSKLLENIEGTIVGQSAEFQQNINKELESNLMTFSSTLAKISNTFAEDYTPLATKLSEVIKIVEQKND